MVAFRSFAIALLAVTYAAAKGLLESDSFNLSGRQVATGDICAQVDLVLLGIVIARGVCVCLQDGVITPTSLNRVTTTISANQGVLAPIINTVGGLAGATTRVVSGLAPLVLQQGTTCTYPDNAEPNQCGGCGYVCATGFVACGAFCIAPGRPCVSGIPGRKRDLLLSDSLSARCPAGFEACLLPGTNASDLKSFSGYECIKTVSDLESCGGCVNPFPGRPTGVDCSGIPNVGTASCSSGKCIIESCARGFNLVDGACVSSGKKLSYWAALEDAAKVVVQV